MDLSKGKALNDGWGKKDTLISIEAIRGSESYGDLLIGDKLDNSIDARGGGDTLKGHGGDDTLGGGDGDDLLDGGDGGDWLAGGAGDDTLIGGVYAWSGLDPKSTTGDWDRLDYRDATGAISADLPTGIVTGDASVGTDSVSHVEEIFGTDYDDSFIGGQPGAEWEQVTGGPGNDTIDASQSADPMFDAQAQYADAQGGITATLAGTGGTVSGAGVGTDTLIKIAYLRGSRYNDTFDISAFEEGADGNSYNRIRAGAGDDTITGNGDTNLDFIDGRGSLGILTDLKTGTVDASHVGLGVGQLQRRRPGTRHLLR